jgi:hypothetical protein
MDNNNQDKSGFSYTYSAKEQAEVKQIREKYTAPTQSENKMERLRRLDAEVTKSASAVALVVGVIGTLILGCGMSLCMTDIGALLGLQGNMSIAVGITVGVIGGIIASVAYPIYNAIVKAKRKKLAPGIIRLADELMK